MTIYIIIQTSVSSLHDLRTGHWFDPKCGQFSQRIDKSLRQDSFLSHCCPLFPKCKLNASQMLEIIFERLEIIVGKVVIILDQEKGQGGMEKGQGGRSALSVY